MKPQPTPPVRTLCCPICGHELGVEPRQWRQSWTARQRWLIRKLHRAGMGPKLIASVFGMPVTATMVAQFLAYDRQQGREAA